MTTRARDVPAVLDQPVADREAGGDGVVFEGRDVRRRRRGRRAEQVFEDPLAADRGGSPRGVGRDRQHAPLPEQAAAVAPGAEVDPAEVAPHDGSDAVVACQPLVQVSMIGFEQREHAPVLADDLVEEESRFRGGTPGGGCRRSRGRGGGRG